jgi:hypothetical protein
LPQNRDEDLGYENKNNEEYKAEFKDPEQHAKLPV